MFKFIYRHFFAKTKDLSENGWRDVVETTCNNRPYYFSGEFKRYLLRVALSQPNRPLTKTCEAISREIAVWEKATLKERLQHGS